ncbi:UDP-glucose--hexose-1-phosphate uridylyltransferase [Maribacter cobaltidurans]|uniref:Galactose-1-phosphate uridylyltransferase n=1 Tax=Maribacter cobaltidurans TaxID=1178778 RepID=A0A223V2T7_9FLAO|nr:UDP-glucose--hexose-1-phosphate uridylyltransferase [Maribacter cobaltidurans]ASV29701.1 galactose-1-phosphate uridylyltransferase [Maribacter cobaltidurans]GGD66610.1 galactose-1-phosphate uridylyltransferase [Maribacter cobaltidurans]
MKLDINEHPHRRYNILNDEWVLVSPHRTKRPWQGKQEKTAPADRPTYDAGCYLCPGNVRANGDSNPNYNTVYSFKNDFSALLTDTPSDEINEGLLRTKGDNGICKVICFSPDHSLTLPLMQVRSIEDVIGIWQKEYHELGDIEGINYVQIFENKGALMGCSNPHPHGQIWSQNSIPQEVVKKSKQQLSYWNENKRSLLGDYLKQEQQMDKRLIWQNEHFAALVPYWAVWPYEVMIIPKRHVRSIADLTEIEKTGFAKAIKIVTTKYDNLFETSFPYSAGIHQAPTDGKAHHEWHFHMVFYPPLLRSATIKKFMVGYELLANPQRDITAEQAAGTLEGLSEVHYCQRK